MFIYLTGKNVPGTEWLNRDGSNKAGGSVMVFGNACLRHGLHDIS